MTGTLTGWAKGFVKDMFHYGAMAAVAKIIGLVMLPIMTRVFSTESYGVIDIMLVLRGFIASLGGLSLTNAVYRYFNEEQEAGHGRLVSSLLLCVAATGLLLLATGLLAKGWIGAAVFGTGDYDALIVFPLLSAFCYNISAIAESALRMERKIFSYNTLNIAYTLAYAGLTLTFIFIFRWSLFGVCLAELLALVLKAALGLFWTRHHLTPALSLEATRRALRFSLPILPADIINWVTSQTDRIVLLTFLGLSNIGVYSAAVRIGIVVNLLTTIFRQAWAPYAMSLINAPQQERNAFYERALIYFASGFACVGLLFTAISRELFGLILPPMYHHGFVVIPWLLGAAILEASRCLTSVGVSISERSFSNTIAATVGAILNLMLALVLIPQFGINGAAVGGFLSQLTFTGILFHYSMRYTKISFDRPAIVKVIAIYIGASVVILAVAQSGLAQVPSLLVRLGIFVACTYALIYRSALCSYGQAKELVALALKRFCPGKA